MVRRSALVLLCGALGCGGGNQSNDAATTPSLTGPQQGTRLASSVEVEVGEQDLRIVLHVTNPTDQPVTLEFNSGQRYDFAVRDAGGREVWRWSRDRMFTQALGTETISASGNLKYEEQVPLRETGVFTAIAVLTSRNYPLEQRTTFERRPR
jgi:hypothetical protein